MKNTMAAVKGPVCGIESETASAAGHTLPNGRTKCFHVSPKHYLYKSTAAPKVWRRAIAASVALVGLLVIIASQAPAVEPNHKLSAKQVKELVASAKTPSDHMKLARHYAAVAENHEAEAAEHEALAAEYTRNPQSGSSKHPMAGNTAEHCKYFAEHCREAAKEMRAMSAAHEQMAKDMR